MNPFLSFPSLFFCVPLVSDNPLFFQPRVIERFFPPFLFLIILAGAFLVTLLLGHYESVLRR